MLNSRRRWIHWLLGGGFGTSLAAFLYPVTRFINPPKVTEAVVNEADVARVSGFPVNSGKVVKFGSKPVLVIRRGESSWLAFSAVCTHLHCTVQYQSKRQRIWCACHNGVYDLHGRVVSGPPPRPLREYAVHIRGNDVIVSRQA